MTLETKKKNSERMKRKSNFSIPRCGTVAAALLVRRITSPSIRDGSAVLKSTYPSVESFVLD